MNRQRKLAILASVYNVAASADILPRIVASPSNAITLWANVDEFTADNAVSYYTNNVPDPLYCSADVRATFATLKDHASW